jgi:hypothetical protein
MILCRNKEIDTLHTLVFGRLDKTDTVPPHKNQNN